MKVIYKQTLNYFESFSNEAFCNFRKAHSPQNILFEISASWQKSLGKEGFVGSILIDLLKVYDCLPLDLLLAKLQADSFNKDSESLITLKFFYLTNSTQRIKIGSILSSWMNIARGIPERSVFGQLLFNIFIKGTLMQIWKSNFMFVFM